MRRGTIWLIVSQRQGCEPDLDMALRYVGTGQVLHRDFRCGMVLRNSSAL